MARYRGPQSKIARKFKVIIHFKYYNLSNLQVVLEIDYYLLIVII